MTKSLSRIIVAALICRLDIYLDRMESLISSRNSPDKSSSLGGSSHADIGSEVYNCINAFLKETKADTPEEDDNTEAEMEGSLRDLASGWKEPKDAEQWILHVADKIAQGLPLANHTPGDSNNAQATKVALNSVFEGLNIHSDPKTKTTKTQYIYAPDKLTSRNLFPQDLKSSSSNSDDYEDTLWKNLTQFLAALKGLENYRNKKDLWLEAFDGIMMRHTSSLPFANGSGDLSDVSLYDHCRSAASLAIAIYMYHKNTDSFTPDSIKDYYQSKFLLISGDFYGIQDYIFSSHGDIRKFRSKLLRGRSFTVSLFSELAADMICREIGLPSISVALSAAGKFVIIAPNIEETALKIDKVEASINESLVDSSYGENALGLATLEATPDDFMSGRFLDLWEELQLASRKKKHNRLDLNRFGGAANTYLDKFINELDSPICPLCGKRPSSSQSERSVLIDEVGSSCLTCRDHVYLGANLVKKDCVVISRCGADRKISEKTLADPIFGKYQISFTSANNAHQMANDDNVLRIWKIASHTEGNDHDYITPKFINGYVPVFTEDDKYDPRYSTGDKGEDKKSELMDHKPGDPKTFGHMAADALRIKPDSEGFVGVEALGVLKADIDDLGLLMSCGLSNDQFTMSRLSTLSRRLNLFFSLYLPDMLQSHERFNDIYTVFAGGDDLFLIGPWNTIMELSPLLKAEFSKYVCHNEDIHFSAGITFCKPHSPIDRIAEEAESQLSKSKNSGKNSITIFGETVTWDEYESIVGIRDNLERWFEEGLVNNAMLYRLNDLIKMAEFEKRLNSKPQVHISDMECTKWRAYLTYSVSRNAAKHLKGDERSEVASDLNSSLAKWLSDYGAKLRIPLWSFLYDKR